MPNKFQYLLVQQDNAILTVTMNRPEVLNSINDPLLQELTEVIEVNAQDPAVRCVVLTGAGRAFGAGQDLTAFAAIHASAEAIKVSEHLSKYHRLIFALRALPKPVIAAVRGVAAGISCNIALACDLRIASENARFIQAFARIGLVPDGGGAFHLPRLVGMARAMEMALLADEVSGREAERIGLVNRCVPAEQFDAAVSELATRLANGPTRTYGLIKELMYASLENNLETSLELEGKLQDEALKLADHREGVAAFLQKRPAKFTGA